MCMLRIYSQLWLHNNMFEWLKKRSYCPACCLLLEAVKLCLYCDLIDLFEKDSFLFVKRVLPFAFASCVRDFKSNLEFGKTTFRYMNKLPNLN